MNFLEVVQSVCLRVGIPAPAVAVQSTDPQVQQIVELIHEEGDDLQFRYPWQALRGEASWLAGGTGDEGALTTLAPGFSRMIEQTFWDQSRRWRVNGPLTPVQWEQIKSLRSPGTGPYYRIFGNHVNTYPAIPLGNTAVFEYVKKWFLYDSTGAKEYATNDTDSFYLDERAITLGGIWRWKQAKGFAYDEDFKKYEYRVEMLMARDASKPIVSLAGNTYGLPGLNIPDRNWTV